jgi:hypothetical protein
MDQNTLQAMKDVLYIVGTLIAIVVGILTILNQLKKLAPGWPTHFKNWFFLLGPALFTLAGLFILDRWDAALIAINSLFIGFCLQTWAFLRESKPMDRLSIATFGVVCAGFAILVSLAFASHFIIALQAVLSKQEDMIESLVDLLKGVRH